MKLSYTDIKAAYLRNIGKTGSTDTTLLADFNINLAQRYQMVLAKMQDYQTQEEITDTTVASQQFYQYPRGLLNIESVVVTVGSVKYPLGLINAQHQWDVLNAIQVQPTAIPQFFFPRRLDYGIWPIPKDAYVITFNYHYRRRDLAVEDYTTGTVTMTNGDATVANVATATFDATMVGKWLQITTTSSNGVGYWYRIASVTDAGNLELESTWAGVTGTLLLYKICDVPEIPDEGHRILVDGVTADYYAGMRADVSNATWWNNVFWTGDGQNSSRNEGDQSIKSGLIGLMNAYTDRNNSRIVNRRPKLSPLGQKVWAYSIT